VARKREIEIREASVTPSRSAFPLETNRNESREKNIFVAAAAAAETYIRSSR